MKRTHLPRVAALAIFGFAVGFVPGLAQLPPTNMGKYIHQPGDNQYSDQTQASRHGGGPQQVVRPVQVIMSAGYRPAPAPRKPDPTLEPIAADEPIPPAGFPPVPDRLDLPVGTKSSWTGGGGGGYGGGGDGGGYGGGGGGFAGGGGGGGPAPGMGGGGAPAPPTFHQHYGHVEPGSSRPKQGGGQGYYKAIDAGLPSKGGQGYYKAIDAGLPSKGGGGYYKAKTPGSDYYGSSGQGGGPGGAGGPPAYTGASARDLKALGKEPSVNEREDQSQAAAPEAPTPVVVNQATTQDLSLPEDEFELRNAQRNAGRKGKGGGGLLKGPLNSVGGLSGVRF